MRDCTAGDLLHFHLLFITWPLAWHSGHPSASAALLAPLAQAVEAEKWRLLALRRQGRTVPMARKAQYLKQLR
jgi:hypothetical protein